MKKLSFFMFAILAMALAVPAFAATTNPSPASPGYTPMVIPFDLVSSARTGVVKFKAPVGYSVKSASIAARSVSGTSPTVKLRGKNGSLVNYSGSLVGTGPTDLSIVSGAALSDEVTQSIDLVTGGTSPRFTDFTLILFLKRK